jgi:hypothetical protein
MSGSNTTERKKSELKTTCSGVIGLKYNLVDFCWRFPFFIIKRITKSNLNRKIELERKSIAPSARTRYLELSNKKKESLLIKHYNGISMITRSVFNDLYGLGCLLIFASSIAVMFSPQLQVILHLTNFINKVFICNVTAIVKLSLVMFFSLIQGVCHLTRGSAKQHLLYKLCRNCNSTELCGTKKSIYVLRQLEEEHIAPRTGDNTPNFSDIILQKGNQFIAYATEP